MKLTLGLVGAFILAVILLSVVLAHGFATVSCGDPDALADAGLYNKALEGYEAILENDAGADCAAEGLLAVAQDRCAQADQIRKSGALPEATKAYTAVLSSQPSEDDKPKESTGDPLDCALDGLAEIRKANDKNGDKKKPAKTSSCTCVTRCMPACVGIERQEAERQEPELQEPEKQEPEQQEAEEQEPELQERERGSVHPYPCSDGECDWTF
jgi:hypothetical protein